MTRQGQCKIERSDLTAGANSMHFFGHQSLCLLNCLRSKNTQKTRKVFKTFSNWQLNLRSWKTWKGHGKSHGIGRAEKSTNPVWKAREGNEPRGEEAPLLFLPSCARARVLEISPLALKKAADCYAGYSTSQSSAPAVFRFFVWFSPFLCDTM